MPTNIGSETLSALKIGESAVSKAYVGTSQIFPNNTEITAAAFDDANIADTGGNTPYTVSGEIGSTFTLTGSGGATAPSGTQIISVSPTTYQISIGSNTNCDDPQRNSQVIIAPQGDSILASGLSNTDTIIQAAGPATTNYTSTLSISATSNCPTCTVTIGGVLYWTTGASWDVTVSWSGLQGYAPICYLRSSIGWTHGTWSNLGTGTLAPSFSGASGSETTTFSLNSGLTEASIYFSAYTASSTNCLTDTNSPTTTPSILAGT